MVFVVEATILIECVFCLGQEPDTGEEPATQSGLWSSA